VSESVTQKTPKKAKKLLEFGSCANAGSKSNLFKATKKRNES
jgi:hypothetical protein